MPFGRRPPEPVFQHRAGEVHEGTNVCRALHPLHGWAYYVVDNDPAGPNFEKPVRWVEEVPEDPEHKGGHWVYLQDC